MLPSIRSTLRLVTGLTIVVVASTTLVSPVAAATLKGVTAITAGQSHACARLASGQARCWGYNGSGQIGDGTKDDRGAAVKVSNAQGTGPLTGVARLAAGAQHVCALLTSRQVRCWGANFDGQLGDGTTDGRTRPVVVRNPTGTGPLRHVKAIASGGAHSCALVNKGRVRCWGENTDGQLGDGTKQERHRPVLVLNPSGTGPLTGVVGLDAGISHTCARLTSGQARCWGRDTHGALGNGAPEEDSLLPVAVRNAVGSGPLRGVKDIDAGEYHTCVRLDTGRARCWGYNFNGEVGDGTTHNRSRPVAVKGTGGAGQLTGIVDVALGGSNSCARLSNLRVRCWGADDDGQLADGTPSDYSSIPVVTRTSGGGQFSNTSQLAVGFAFNCARLRNGTARCWGDNGVGQVGDGSFAQAPFPVAVVQ